MFTLRLVLCTIIIGASFQQTNAQSFSWAQGFTATSNFGALIQTNAIDGMNNMYSIGRYSGTIDVDNGPSVYNFSSVGIVNMFLLKEDAAGNFLWAKNFVGLSSGVLGIVGYAMDFDANGNIYIAGVIQDSVDVDPGPLVYKLSTNGGYHAFILKLDNSGNFIWAKTIGNTIITNNSAEIMDISVLNDAIFLVGTFNGVIDADPGPSITNVSSAGLSDILVEKLDTAGNFIWAKTIGGAGGQECFALSTDSTSNLYIAGGYQYTVDFDPGPGVFYLTAVTSQSIALLYDVFVEKLDSLGNFVWAKSVGGSGDDRCNNLALDQLGNVFLTGHFGDTVDFDPGPGVYNLTANSTRSIFTLKLRNNGDFAWARKAGGFSGLYSGNAVATDSFGNVYTAAETPGGCDMDPGPGYYFVNKACSIQKLDSSGIFVWARSWDGTPTWLGLDHNNGIYTTGFFSGQAIDFDPGPGTFLLSGTGQNSGFIEKLCQNPAAISVTSTAETSCTGDTVLLSATAMTGASYRWYKNGIALPDSTSTIKVTTSGTYIAEAGNGCAGYDTVTVTFWSPYHPNITILGINQQIAVGQIVFLTALVTNGVFNDTIDWYKNGMLDPNYHSTTFNYYKSPGTDTIIAVVHKRNNPCYFSDTSNIRIISEPVGIAALSKQNIAVFPNPFSQNITIDGLDINDKVLLTDLRGVKLQEWQASQRSENFVTKDLAPGFYIYKIADEEGRVKQYGGMVKE